MLDMIKAQMISSVPFAAHTGVELLELSQARGVARLIQRREVSNHVKTIHAGALFTLAEAASGAAMAGIFAEHILSIRPVVSDARISYLKSARGEVTATATALAPAPELLAKLSSEGSAIFDVQVGITDANSTTVATFVATWNVKKP
jgi:uncharacterized protein (TIGR00369 family)